MMLATIDPRIEVLAEVGNTDPSYKMLVELVEKQTESKQLEENCQSPAKPSQAKASRTFPSFSDLTKLFNRSLKKKTI